VTNPTSINGYSVFHQKNAKRIDNKGLINSKLVRLQWGTVMHELSSIFDTHFIFSAVVIFKLMKWRDSPAWFDGIPFESVLVEGSWISARVTTSA
jgi:hypothetical protein